MAGHGDQHAVISAGLIKLVHRVRQKYLVQHLDSLHVAAADAENGKGRVRQLLGGNGDLFTFPVAGVEVLALGEEEILGGFHGV